MKIGFIGIGVMGSRMAQRLLEAKYEVMVYNRTKSKAMLLIDQGAKMAENVSELAKQCDVICTCLSMPEDVAEVYGSEEGILAHAKQNTICIDFTTVDPNTSRSVADQAREEGIHFLDAPISGGPEGAEQASLTIMVGGEVEIYHKVLPIFNRLGSTVEYMGASGSGSITKLINQYLVAVHSLAASEAMVTGAFYGLRAEQLYEVLKVSYGDSRMLRRHMDQYVLQRNFEPGGAIKYVHKDVRLANQLLKETGLPSFTGQLAERSFQAAISDGLGDLDMSAVIQPLEKECRVEVKISTSQES